MALEPACVAEAIEKRARRGSEGRDEFRMFAGDWDVYAYNRAFTRACAMVGQPGMAAALCDLIRNGRSYGARQRRQVWRGLRPDATVLTSMSPRIEAMAAGADSRGAARIIQGH